MKTHREMIRRLVKALTAAGKRVPDPAASQKYQQIANEAAQWLIDTQPKPKTQWDLRDIDPNIMPTKEQGL
jgi:hypothetical protein